MFFLESERLKLIPLTHQLLQLCYANRADMERSIGLNVSAMQIEPFYIDELEDAMLNFWLPKTLEHADNYQWYTNWEMVLKATNTSIGGIGFAGCANADGEVEVGYMVEGRQQRLGYATEALSTIIHWAFKHEHVKAVIAHTHINNNASQRLLLKSGFVKVHTGVELLRFKCLNK